MSNLQVLTDHDCVLLSQAGATIVLSVDQVMSVCGTLLDCHDAIRVEQLATVLAAAQDRGRRKAAERESQRAVRRVIRELRLLAEEQGRVIGIDRIEEDD